MIYTQWLLKRLELAYRRKLVRNRTITDKNGRRPFKRIRGTWEILILTAEKYPDSYNQMKHVGLYIFHLGYRKHIWLSEETVFLELSKHG